MNCRISSRFVNVLEKFDKLLNVEFRANYIIIAFKVRESLYPKMWRYCNNSILKIVHIKHSVVNTFLFQRRIAERRRVYQQNICIVVQFKEIKLFQAELHQKLTTTYTEPLFLRLLLSQTKHLILMMNWSSQTLMVIKKYQRSCCVY